MFNVESNLRLSEIQLKLPFNANLIVCNQNRNPTQFRRLFMYYFFLNAGYMMM